MTHSHSSLQVIPHHIHKFKKNLTDGGNRSHFLVCRHQRKLRKRLGPPLWLLNRLNMYLKLWFQFSQSTDIRKWQGWWHWGSIASFWRGIAVTEDKKLSNLFCISGWRRCITFGKTQDRKPLQVSRKIPYLIAGDSISRIVCVWIVIILCCTCAKQCITRL